MTGPQLIQQGITFNPCIVLNEKIENKTRKRNLYFKWGGGKHYLNEVIFAVGVGF
ncbi:hypothetical protein M3181_15970 [Mesobacillus maritimus]|uniref:hypothetical protein n=1 Tax=Mesobacillus maritimus TaxID=1643336 RepID=UPI00203FE106|nr:hypothetical protein [Mesobacillus maritimus]MCM3670463.1 hypothetical protein [Mesobacillus maritimus]